MLLTRFHDPADGGFFFTSSDHVALFQRPKPLADESMPAGNGVAAMAPQRLGHLLGEPRYPDAATGTLKLAAEPMRRLPYARATLLAALDEHLNPTKTIVIRGGRGDAIDDELRRWQAAAQETFAPRRVVLAIPADEPDLPGGIDAMQPAETRPRLPLPRHPVRGAGGGVRRLCRVALRDRSRAHRLLH